MKASIKTDAIKSLDFLKSPTRNEYIDDLAKLTEWHAKTKSPSPFLLNSLLGFFELIQPKNQSMLHINKYSQNNLKYHLLKIKLAFDKVDPSEIDKFAQSMGHTNFVGLLTNIKGVIDKQTKFSVPEVDSGVDQSWTGTRYGVEVPSMRSKHGNPKKDLSSEILNRKFMWCDQYYFSYKDWKYVTDEAYVKSPNDLKSNEKYFYQDQWRRTMSGVFPDAKNIQPLIQTGVRDQFKDIFGRKLDQDKSDQLDWASPNIENRSNKAMIGEELRREKPEITPEFKMILNLQNLKHTLKKTHKDSEILNFLTGFDFTDSLIDAHLKNLNNEGKPEFSKLQLVSRDASEYRSYLKSLDKVKDRYDPFTNFFLEQSQAKEYVNEILPQKVKNARTAEEREKYQEILDNALMIQEFNENSRISVGTHVVKNYDIKFDLDTLLRDENEYEIDSDLYADDISDNRFLHNQRCKAESNFIKSKILTKLHYDQSLSDNEARYLKAWRENIGGTMIPSQPSTLKIGDLNERDKASFNNLPLIDVSGLEDYALNDVLLELNHFIDPHTIKELETEVHVDTLKGQWGIPKDLVVSERRHKEIDLVLGQIEENAYRHSGQFEKHEIEGMIDMFKTDIDEGIFNKEWLRVDLHELENFPYNECDDRLDLLERWFEKKEREIKSRIHLPREHMLDQKLYRAKLQEKTHELISKLFKKSYEEITEPELNEFVTGLCSRMTLFDKFPSFMPYLIYEITKHPQINKVDKDKLETYSDMFDIKWREDSNKPLWLSPINTDFSRKVDDSLDPKVAPERLRQASCGAPYIKDLKQKFIDMSN